ALASMAISATLGTLSLLLSGAVTGLAFWPTWSVWWTGDAMGVLVVAPFLLSLRSRRGSPSMSAPRRFEAFVLAVAIALAALAVFRTDLHVQYLVFPLLGWAAWRFGLRGASSAALLASGVAAWAAVRGWG